MKTETSVLALARDMGSANVIGPIVQELRNRGFKVVLFAEEDGKGIDKFRQAGIDFSPLLAGSSLEDMVHTYNPEVVITGLSSPRHLESDLDREARKRGIPVVNVEDYWGVHARCVAPPDLVITIDKTSAVLVHQAYPKARLCIAGLAGILPVIPRPEGMEKFDQLRRNSGAKIVVFTDGDIMCKPGLRLLCECIRLTKMPVRLVPNFHPKYVNAPMPGYAGTWGERWEEVLQPLRDIGGVCDIACTGDEAAMLADATVSSFSTLLFRAANMGKHAITVWTEAAAAHVGRVANLKEAPLMMKGGFPVIREPVPLDDILASTPPRLNINPFDAAVAADAVQKFL